MEKNSFVNITTNHKKMITKKYLNKHLNLVNDIHGLFNQKDIYYRDIIDLLDKSAVLIEFVKILEKVQYKAEGLMICVNVEYFALWFNIMFEFEEPLNEYKENDIISSKDPIDNEDYKILNTKKISRFAGYTYQYCSCMNGHEIKKTK